jgi:hypothetical protein
MTRKSTTLILAAAVALGTGVATLSAHAEKQPKMRAALAQLHKAKETLKDAEADKGGHRVKAVQLLDEAIKEVEAGITYDDTHKK